MLHAAALHYFREVARARSIRRGAAALNVSASAVNRQMLNLEADLGAPLFDRLPRGLRLTPAGELLLRHVDHTLLDFDRLRAAIDDLRGARTGHVTIAAVDSLLVDFLPRAIDRFRADFPAVTYAVTAAAPPDILSMVAAGDADLGFTFVGQTPHSVRWLAEIAAPIGVVMRAAHPLAARRAVGFAELAHYPLLTQSGPLPKGADPDGALAAFKDSVTPKLQSNAIQLIKLALTLDMGVSLFTRLGFLSEIERGELVWRPLDSPAINALRLGLAAPAQRDLAASARQLAQRLEQDLRRLAAS